MWKVVWTRYGRYAGEEVFDTREQALKFFNRLRNFKGVGSAEMKFVE